MESSSLLNDLINHLIENHSIDFNQKGKPKIEEFSMSGHGISKRFFYRFLNDRKEFKTIHAPLLEMSDLEIIEELNNIFPSIIDALSDHIRKTTASEFNEKVGVHTLKEEYMNFIPIVDVMNPRGESTMVDKDTGRVVDATEKSWEKMVGLKHAKLAQDLGHGGYFEYDPRSTSSHRDIEVGGRKATMFNKFIPPSYRLKRNTEAKLDQRFIDFLEGFFEPTCKEYAYNWIYHSAFSRVPIYLVLVGAGGIGKNLLAESLKMLHGHLNFTKAPPSALDTKFNGHLINCTMLYYDECKFSAGKEGATTRKNRLKEWANDYVPIETKGVDAKGVDIYCSAIIATNNDSDVHLDQLDRKFSVMELSEDRLESRMGVEKTQFLWEYIRQNDFGDALLNFLEKKTTSKFNIHVEYKGPKFHQLVLSSLYGWQQELLARIEDSETGFISLKDCRENISLFPKHNTKVDDFLKNFTVKGHKLGKVVTVEGKPKIKITEELLPPPKGEDDLNKGDL